MINNLPSQRYSEHVEISRDFGDEISSRLLFFKITGKRISDASDIDEEDIDKLVAEINRLKYKYEDLIYVIESDPGLKEYFEQKLKLSKTPGEIKNKNYSHEKY